MKGVTYSRPNPGTGMPSQERFRARPMWACLEPCPASQNYQFWIGQQPKPQISFLFWSHTYFSEHSDSSKGKPPLQAGICVRDLLPVNASESSTPEQTNGEALPWW